MKKTLLIMYGGQNCEHDISIITAHQAMDNADTSKYDVVPVYIDKQGRWFTGGMLREMSFHKDFDEKQVIRCQLVRSEAGCELVKWPPKLSLFGGGPQVLAKPDVCLLAFHGMNGEDGSMQGLLELMDVPYTSAGLMGSSVGMDKIAMKAAFRGIGMPVLPMCWFDRAQWQKDPDAVLDRIEGELTYPMFIKPANLGSSIGISRAIDREALKKGIEVAVHYDRRVMVENGIDSPMEINCAVVGFGDEVQPSLCEMPISWESFLTFEEKYIAGAKSAPSKGMTSLRRQVPAPIDPELTERIQQMCCDIFRALDLRGVVRIDLMIDRNGGNLYVNEINTIPGSLAFYLFEPMGISFTQLIDKMVDYAEKASEEKHASSFSFQSGVLDQFGGAKGVKGAKFGGAKR